MKLASYINKMMKNLKLQYIVVIVIGLVLLYNLGMNVKEGLTNQADASSALPQGIPKSEIPPGDEDLYIRKSEIVPPVCPKCPDINTTGNTTVSNLKCPPCPPCGRCKEPSFECKKVPTYSAVNNNNMPRPVLADFSNFGM